MKLEDELRGYERTYCTIREDEIKGCNKVRRYNKMR